MEQAVSRRLGQWREGSGGVDEGGAGRVRSRDGARAAGVVRRAWWLLCGPDHDSQRWSTYLPGSGEKGSFLDQKIIQPRFFGHPTLIEYYRFLGQSARAHSAAVLLVRLAPPFLLGKPAEGRGGYNISIVRIGSCPPPAESEPS